MRHASLRLLVLVTATAAACNNKGPPDRQDGEVLDGDSATEDDCTPVDFYRDGDGDGYGDPDQSKSACEAPDGYVADALDCNDGNGDIYPGAEEICDDRDNDCDDQVDEDLDITWYLDNDFDGYGDADTESQSCAPPSTSVDNGDDCDDADPGVNPGAADICNGLDENCDGAVDNDVKADSILVTVGNDAVYEIDVTDASTTWLADIDRTVPTMSTSDATPDGDVYTHDNTSNDLLLLDPCTGALSEVSQTNTGGVGGMAFVSAALLYGTDADTSALLRMSLSGGSGTLVGSLGIELGNNGLSYACSDETLYGIDADLDQLYQVDTTSGVAKGFVDLGIDMVNVGMEFSALDQALYVSDGTTLYLMDPADGSTTTIGSFDLVDPVNDLVLVPACGG